MVEPRTSQSSGSEVGKKIADQEQALKDCEAIESDLAALRASYEQYFLGIERKPPTVEHGRLKKQINGLKGAFVRQTAVKFRINNLHSKFISYERLWSRTIHEMEDGTYHRDVYKAKLHAKKKAAAEQAPKGEKAGQGAPELGPEPKTDPEALLAAGGPPPAAASKPSSPPKPAAPVAPVASGAALSDGKLKAIFEAYVKAKKRCNEDVSKLSFDSMSATLKKQVPELLKQHKAKSIDFKVVIKDGKAVLRAVPKE